MLQSGRFMPRQLSPEEQVRVVVSYYKGLFSLRRRRGMLEWTTDDRIRLSDVQIKGQRPSSVAFDVAPEQIKRVSGTGGTMYLKIEGVGTYAIVFSGWNLFWLMGGGSIGLTMSDKVDDRSGLTTWTNMLTSRGVKSGYTRGSQLIKLAFILAPIAFIGLMIVVYYIVRTNPDLF